MMEEKEKALHETANNNYSPKLPSVPVEPLADV